MKFIILTLIIFTSNVFSQIVIEKYNPPSGYLRTGIEQDQMVQMVEKGFSLILPEKEIKGVIIVPGGKRSDYKELANIEGTLENEALKKNIAVIHIISGNPLEFYFNNDDLVDAVKKLQSVLTDNNLKGKPAYFLGTSLTGTRALKLAIFLQKNRAKYWLQPAAVAIVDAPLDMVRYWDVQNRAVLNKFHPDASEEGRWVTYLLKENLGIPGENFNNYVEYSPFVYTASDGGNAKHLRNIPVRAYHNPDVNWWIENRRKDYYGMNSIDMAAFINQLKLLNNSDTELVTTYQSRHDSSQEPGTPINYAEMMDWFLSLDY